MKYTGVWHRPDDTGEEIDLNGLKEVVKKFASAGVNIVFLESFYHGFAAYRSEFVPYNPKLAAYKYGDYPDYLSAFVAEAEKLGIEVHAWVENFYVGVEENIFTRDYPDWLLKNKDGGVRQSEGGGYLFLDPANGEVGDFLVRIYLELLSKNIKIKGLNLDYIRYPLTTKEDDAGYTEAALTAFEKLYGKRPADDFEKWIDFRADCVTAFVTKARAAVKRGFPCVKLSTAVFPERKLSYETKKQDFARWLSEKLLDFVTPMAYYDDCGRLSEALEEMISFCGETPCLAGLSCVYHGLPVDEVAAQIKTSVGLGAKGVVFFGSKALLGNGNYLKFLGGK